MAPVDAGYCQYESLKNGVLDLVDLWRMNTSIAVRNENNYRLTWKT